jgi:hypothetical protein
MGEFIPFFSYGVNHIATDIQHHITDESVVMKFRGVRWEEVKGLSGMVDLLIGFDNHDVFPVETAREQDMALWKSKFGTGWMLAGRPAAGCTCGDYGCRSMAVSANSALTIFKPPDFISAEAFGTETPAHYAACRNCKECKFRAEMVSFKEYETILNGLTLDIERKKWTASTPSASLRTRWSTITSRPGRAW